MHSNGLLMYLLYHEVLPAALFSLVQIPVDFEDFLLHSVSECVENFYAVLRDLCDFIVFKNVNFLCIFEKCGKVGSEDVLSFSQSDYERAVRWVRNNYED